MKIARNGERDARRRRGYTEASEDVDVFGDSSPMKGECKNAWFVMGRGEARFEVRQGVGGVTVSCDE